MLVEPPGRLHPGHDRPGCSADRTWIRFSPGKSVRMKSSSAGPDFVRMSRCSAAIEASVCARSARRRAPGSVSTGGAAGAGRRPGAGPSVRHRPDEVAALDDGLQRVPDQRIGSAQDRQQTGRGWPATPAAGVTSTNNLPPASYMRPGRGQLEHREPEGLHRVGHHLLVADGDVDVVVLVVGLGDGEQRRDRPALDDRGSRRRRGTTRCPAGGRSAPRSAGPAAPAARPARRSAPAAPAAAGRSPLLACRRRRGTTARCLAAIVLATTWPSRTL